MLVYEEEAWLLNGTLVSGLLLSNSFAGLVAAGILKGMQGVGSLAAWRWLFILEGCATVIMGIVAMLVLPDYPGTTKWLREEEQIVAQARLSKDVGTTDSLGEMETPLIRGIVWRPSTTAPGSSHACRWPRRPG